MKKIVISVMLDVTPALAFAGPVTNGGVGAKTAETGASLPCASLPQSPQQQINAMLAVPFRTKSAAVAANVKQW
ncbi:MAG: hypothetical protein ACYCTH_08075 [Cellulomonas sp.]